ncbi:9390_t:CDS:2 [Ambispora leptoticha]|uniref:9390_t:CDS:1 n=1 Tax=Ambispora leptoticha TaxID=144679 RepID=A0A9N9A5L9_9GLOM|nr:9390_t:CDS:2 [Ambispora leptoticha]
MNPQPRPPQLRLPPTPATPKTASILFRVALYHIFSHPDSVYYSVQTNESFFGASIPSAINFLK